MKAIRTDCKSALSGLQMINFMKKIFNIVILFSLISCSVSSKKIQENYVLNKEENNSYNLILSLDENNRYSLNVISSGSSGETLGTWTIDKKTLILNPDIEISNEVEFDGEKVRVTEFRPFLDTIKFEIKCKKLIRIDNRKFILYAQTR